MIEKLNKRKQREIDAIQSGRGVERETDNMVMVSDEELFQELGERIKKK